MLSLIYSHIMNINFPCSHISWFEFYGRTRLKHSKARRKYCMRIILWLLIVFNSLTSCSSEIWNIMSEFDQIYANDFTLLLVWKWEHKTTYSFKVHCELNVCLYYLATMTFQHGQYLCSLRYCVAVALFFESFEDIFFWGYFKKWMRKRRANILK